MQTLGWILLVVLFCAGLVLWESTTCESRWARAGFQARYGITTGCLVETKPGLWIPEKNYRQLEDK